MQLETVPKTTLDAVVTLLTPHCPDLSPTALVRAIRAYDPNLTEATADRLLDKYQAAQILNVSCYTITRWAREGLLEGKHIGKSWRFRLSAVEAMGAIGEEG
jgi:excisionase family DNA binding protein